MYNAVDWRAHAYLKSPQIRNRRIVFYTNFVLHTKMHCVQMKYVVLECCRCNRTNAPDSIRSVCTHDALATTSSHTLRGTADDACTDFVWTTNRKVSAPLADWSQRDSVAYFYTACARPESACATRELAESFPELRGAQQHSTVVLSAVMSRGLIWCGSTQCKMVC